MPITQRRSSLMQSYHPFRISRTCRSYINSFFISRTRSLISLSKFFRPLNSSSRYQFKDAKFCQHISHLCKTFCNSAQLIRRKETGSTLSGRSFQARHPLDPSRISLGSALSERMNNTRRLLLGESLTAILHNDISQRSAQVCQLDLADQSEGREQQEQARRGGEKARKKSRQTYSLLRFLM